MTFIVCSEKKIINLGNLYFDSRCIIKAECYKIMTSFIFNTWWLDVFDRELECTMRKFKLQNKFVTNRMVLSSISCIISIILVNGEHRNRIKLTQSESKELVIKKIVMFWLFCTMFVCVHVVSVEGINHYIFYLYSNSSLRYW